MLGGPDRRVLREAAQGRLCRPREEAPELTGTILIRDATTADLDELSRLLAATWHATYDAIYGAARVTDITGRWHAPEALARALGNSEARFRVAETVDGALAATASASIGRGGIVKLDRLYVRPAFQRRGIGVMLLDDALAAWPDATLMRLEVEPRNLGAVAFYTARGFRPASRSGERGGSGDSIVALVMERPLPM